jgi:hypothetical protein
MRIRYIEEKPIKQTIDFEGKTQWSAFFEKRIKDILDYTYPNKLDYREYFVYKRITLNKNGTPRKEIDPVWLYSKKAIKKRQKNWKSYCEKRKKNTKTKNAMKRLSEIEFDLQRLQGEKKEIEEELKR